MISSLLPLVLLCHLPRKMRNMSHQTCHNLSSIKTNGNLFRRKFPKLESMIFEILHRFSKYFDILSIIYLKGTFSFAIRLVVVCAAARIDNNKSCIFQKQTEIYIETMCIALPFDYHYQFICHWHGIWWKCINAFASFSQSFIIFS